MFKKKKRLIVISAIIITITGIAVFLFFFPGESFIAPAKSKVILVNHPPRISDVMPYIQDGDIILRMTAGTWSRSFREYSLVDKRFSHCGIVRMRDDKVTIINALGSFSNPNMGVEETILRHFVIIGSAVGIFRIRGVDGSAISDAAAQCIGRPFDFDFDLEDDSKVYCTELLYISLKAVNSEHILPTIYVDQVSKDVIPIDSISNNPAIDELVYIVDQTAERIDQENQVVLKRDNPIKVSFIQRMVINLWGIKKLFQKK